MGDFWWLLIIPVVFGLGWIAARVDLKHLLAEQANLPRSYFQGLNFLLNEQHDQAIDAFIEVAKLDPETTELHFALGNLFRRRGETGRAIRVHQSLLTRTDLPEADRNHARYALGQDFLKAGFLDRAEETLSGLISGHYALDAQRSLMILYTIEKEWQRALDIAKQLHAVDDSIRVAQKKQNYTIEISHFYCELAQESLQHKAFDAAFEALNCAQKANPSNVRVLLLRGEALFMATHVEKAIETWKSVEQQNVDYLLLIIPNLIEAYRALGHQRTLSQLLIEYLDRYTLSDLLELAYPCVLESEGIEVAQQYVRTQMKKKPSLVGMACLLEAQMTQAEPVLKVELEWMYALIERYIKHLSCYTCQNCGFRARSFYWQCPGCMGWETYLPRRMEWRGS